MIGPSMLCKDKTGWFFFTAPVNHASLVGKILVASGVIGAVSMDIL